MVRQAAMVLKCILLMYYKNSRGRDNHKQVSCFMNLNVLDSYLIYIFYICTLVITCIDLDVCQGQLLTLVEYLLLLYRALLPTPVWYQFFLNKEYGSFFSSLTTGLYLTFKLTSVVEKVLFVKITKF